MLFLHKAKLCVFIAGLTSDWKTRLASFFLVMLCKGHPASGVPRDGWMDGLTFLPKPSTSKWQQEPPSLQNKPEILFTWRNACATLWTYHKRDSEENLEVPSCILTAFKWHSITHAGEIPLKDNAKGSDKASRVTQRKKKEFTSLLWWLTGT